MPCLWSYELHAFGILFVGQECIDMHGLGANERSVDVCSTAKVEKIQRLVGKQDNGTGKTIISAASPSPEPFLCSMGLQVHPLGRQLIERPEIGQLDTSCAPSLRPSSLACQAQSRGAQA